MEYAALVIIFVFAIVLFFVAALEGGLWDGIKSIKDLFAEGVPSSVFFIGLLFAIVILVGAAIVEDGLTITDILTLR